VIRPARTLPRSVVRQVGLKYRSAAGPPIEDPPWWIKSVLPHRPKKPLVLVANFVKKSTILDSGTGSRKSKIRRGGLEVRRAGTLGFCRFPRSVATSATPVISLAVSRAIDNMRTG
jgi:hypothetical protein